MFTPPRLRQSVPGEEGTKSTTTTEAAATARGRGLASCTASKPPGCSRDPSSSAKPPTFSRRIVPTKMALTMDEDAPGAFEVTKAETHSAGSYEFDGDDGDYYGDY